STPERSFARTARWSGFVPSASWTGAGACARIGMLRRSRAMTKNLKQSIDHSDAVAEALHRGAEPIRHGGPQATHRRSGLHLMMAMPFADPTADRNNRKRIGRVRIRVAH